MTLGFCPLPPLHWNCSGFSVTLRMRRTFSILMLAVALFAAPAFAHTAHGKKAEAPVRAKSAAKHTARHTESHGAAHADAKPARHGHHSSQQAEAAPAPKLHRGRHHIVAEPAIEPRIHGRRGRNRAITRAMLREAAASPLRGNFESLERQNIKTEAEGLERIEDDADLRDRVARHQLVSLPASESLIVNPGMPEDRRYCRPWTASFLSDLAAAHDAEFHRPLIVSSAVRTVEFQRHLMRINGNAAPAEGDIASPHLTGATIDIAKSPLSNKERIWMRNYLLPLQDAGKIDVEEEFRQSCFHITVYRSYNGAELEELAPAPADAGSR